jgi:hypothetical protein
MFRKARSAKGSDATEDLQPHVYCRNDFLPQPIACTTLSHLLSLSRAQDRETRRVGKESLFLFLFEDVE